MKRLVILLALVAPRALGAADLIVTQQGELSQASYVREGAFTVATDLAEAGSTNQVIIATGHQARVGDLLRFTTAGQNYYVEMHVSSTTANAITLTRTLPGAPSVGDSFVIMRLVTPSIAADGSSNITGSISASNPSVGATGAAVPAQATFAGGRGADGFLHGLSTDNTGALNVVSGTSTHSYVTSVRNDYTGTPVTTGAWVQLIASTPSAASALLVFDSSGSTLEIGTGGAGVETRVLLVTPGGPDALVPITVPSGTRVSIRAVSADATAGEFDANFLN